MANVEYKLPSKPGKLKIPVFLDGKPPTMPPPKDSYLLRKKDPKTFRKAMVYEENFKGGPTDADKARIADTNVENIGSAEDKAARVAAAETESAWVGAGKAAGLLIWRIEKFQVVAWPKEQYGKFYDGDSYVILYTYKDPENENDLDHNLFYWHGSNASQDEQGTAAYKSVELDDLLGGEPVQYRETQACESETFKAALKSAGIEEITYMAGGVDSGFTKVSETTGVHMARLFQVKKMQGDRQTSITEVPCKLSSLNYGDCFIMDAGETIFVWRGKDCSNFEQHAANKCAENMELSKGGNTTVEANVDDSEQRLQDKFWNLLGGKGDITSKEDAEAARPTMAEMGDGVLYKLSDSSNELVINEVARGELKLAMLETNDVFICDAGAAVIVWVGKGASDGEKKNAMQTAVKYLKQKGMPISTPISLFREGKPIHDKLFCKIFA